MPVLAVVLLGAWLWTADLGVFKPQIEQFVKAQTGRDFSVEGDLSIDLARRSVLVAEDIRFSNAPWASKRPMLEVERIEVRVNTWSLFTDRPRLEFVDIDGVRLHLARRTDGPPNWLIEVPASEPQPHSDSPPLDILLQHIEIDDARVRFEDPERDRPIEWAVERLRQERLADDFLQLELVSTLNERRFDAQGRSGPWQALLAGRDIQFGVAATIDTLSLSAQGLIDDAASPARPSFEFTARGADIDDITRILGLGEEGSGDIDLRGAVKPAADGPLVLSMVGNLGQLEIDARAELADLRGFERFDLRLLASGPDLSIILRMAGIHRIREAPFMIDLEATRDGPAFTMQRSKMVFGAATFDAVADVPNFPHLDEGRVSLAIEGPDIERFRYMTRLPGNGTGSFSARIDIQPDDNGLEILDLQLQTTLAMLRANGTLSDDPAYYGSRFSVDVSTQNLGQLGDAYGISDLPNTPLELEGGFEWTTQGVQLDENVMVRAADFAATASGLVVAKQGGVGSDLGFDVKGENLGRFLTTYARADAELGASALLQSEFGVSGALQIRHEKLLLHQLEFLRGQDTVNGTIEVSFAAAEAMIDFDLSGGGDNMAALFAGAGALSFSPQPYSFQAIATWRAKGISVERLALTVGNATVQSSGELNLEAHSKSSLDIALNMPTPADLIRWNDQPLNVPSITLLAPIVGAWPEFSADGLSASIGDNRVEGDLRVVAGDIPDIDVNLRAGTLIFTSSVDAAAANAKTETPPRGDRLIPDTALPLDVLHALNADAAITIGELRHNDRRVTGLKMRGQLHDGVLDIRQFGFAAPSGRLDARLNVTPVGDHAEITLSGEAIDYGVSLLAFDPATSMQADINLDLTATGGTLRQLLGTLTGIVFVDARGGQAPRNSYLSAIYGDMLGEFIDAINPFAKSEANTQFECIVLPLRLQDGVIAAEPNAHIALKKIRITMEPTIDLGSEDIDIDIRTSPRQALGISAAELVNPFIEIAGTLAHPKLALDEKRALLSGGAAVATGGLSLIARATFDRMAGTGDVCTDTASAGREALGLATQ